MKRKIVITLMTLCFFNSILNVRAMGSLYAQDSYVIDVIPGNIEEVAVEDNG